MRRFIIYNAEKARRYVGLDKRPRNIFPVMQGRYGDYLHSVVAAASMKEDAILQFIDKHTKETVAQHDFQWWQRYRRYFEITGVDAYKRCYVIPPEML